MCVNNLVVGGTLKISEVNQMTIEVTILISVISVAFAIFFGIKSNRREDVKIIEERATKNAEINYKLDTISGNVNDIKYDVSATRQKVEDMDKRLVIVEQSAKSAHHRIDRLEGKEEP